LKVGSVSADRGAKSFGLVHVCSTSSWKVELPVFVINGAYEGKTLALTAGFHPNEYTGIEAVYTVCKQLDPKNMHGSLIAVPIVNTPGFQRKMRNNPIDNTNLHACFPGSLDGTSGYRIGHFLATQLISQSNAYLDNHGSDFGEVAPNHVIGVKTGNEKVDRESENLARCYDIKYFRFHQGTGEKNSALDYAVYSEVPAVLSETGSQAGLDKTGQLDAGDLQWNIDGIMNALRYLKIIEGQPKLATPLTITNEAHLRANHAGLFFSKVPIVSNVKKGQIVGEIRDLSGQTIEELVSPMDGVVSLIWDHVAADEGKALIQILEVK
jgi:predicted deacylase